MDRYDPVGNRQVVIDPNGQVTKYLYDVRDSLAEVDQSPSAWTDPAATPSPNDELDRLLSVTSPGPKTLGYRYDRDGNAVLYPADASRGKPC